MWLTDNTYQYEDLVRMMGEVISVLDGKIRVSDFSVDDKVYLDNSGVSLHKTLLYILYLSS